MGKKISQILPNCNSSKVLKNIDEIDWNSFDTLILGHLGELSKLTKVDYYNSLIKIAIDKGKNIYSFDNIEEVESLAYTKYYTPRIDESYVCKRFGKLYKTDKPILSIVGTNSRQGKFTLQLFFRKRLIELGYTVGQIGTEPSSLLFGMDEVFPCGYNGQVYLDIYQTYSVINKMIWDISQKDVDIIITGCQSGLLAYNDRNIKMMPIYHQIIFEALQPDAIIICINPFDDLSFVDRTIKAAEGISGGKVLGLVCFPVDFMEGWKGIYGGQSRISQEKENKIKSEYLERLNQTVYMLDKQNELDELLAKCIAYFQ